MSPEPFHFPGLRARRGLFSALVAATSGAGIAMMARVVSTAGLTTLEAIILVLFAPTFTWIVIPFWTAVAGFTLLMGRRDPVTLARRTDGVADDGPTADAERARPIGLTALAVPTHNEDPDTVAARVAAMCDSLRETGHVDRFHVHLLSDSTDPGIARREERAWLRLQAEHPYIPVHYRRRAVNEGRKAGNLREFCERCGDRYDYMVVLDADSLMAGGTLVELARTLDADPSVGLVQTVPLPVRQQTIFGRFVQLAANLYSPMLATGQAFWQGDAANYWGHNAIVRVSAFTEHAILPVLPGAPPLGGEVLSHDFVEAALLRRAGWKVVLRPDVGGSWEEVPANVIDFAARDRRWAQGSLQHLRLLGEPGWHPLNRLHFLLGAMGYVSSLLWLLILVTGTLYVMGPALHGPALLAEMPILAPPISLLVVTGVVLFLPKALGFALAWTRRRSAFGGGLRLAASAIAETAFSIVIAPIMMLYHARFVTAIVSGRSVEWLPQERNRTTLSWRDSLRAAAVPTTVALLWGGATWATSPGFLVWMSPILLGLLLAAPLIRWTSTPNSGALARSVGLLLVPSEATPPPEVRALSRALGHGWGRERAVQPEVCSGSLAPDPSSGSGVSHASSESVRLSPKRVGRSMHNAERGLFDLRQGRPLLVTVPETERDARDTLVASVEELDPELLDRLRRLGSGEPTLVLTGHRIAAMRLSTNGSNDSNGTREHAGGRPLANHSIQLPPDADVERILELACDSRPALPLNGLRPAHVPESAALSLVRLGRLLPAVVAVPVDRPHPKPLVDDLSGGAVLSADADEIRDFVASSGAEVVRVGDAPVPLAEAEQSRFVLFREVHGFQEHVAILVGREEQWPDPVPVRLHSACLTGDLFGSLRCDCGEQLRGSLEIFSARGGGILLYLAQEGRGIGLSNKFRAYTLQEGGLDTIDADGTLGFGPDERSYDVAVRILEGLGVSRIELLTNNPEKVRAMHDAGISVLRRQPLHGTLTRHNLPYVKAKVHRAGHWLGDMLSQPLSGD